MGKGIFKKILSTFQQDDSSTNESTTSSNVPKQISFEHLRQAYEHHKNNSVNEAYLPFIKRVDHILYEGYRVFRFASMNIPNLHLIEDKPGRKGTWLLPHPLEQEDAIKSIAGLHGKVARIYTLGFGPGLHVIAPQTYNENAFQALDNALALAVKYRIRLIIPFINHGYSTDSYGTFGSFAKLRGVHPLQFFNDPTMINDMKHLINYVLTRRNTITGILYKDDPAILAWQLGNELGSWEDLPPPAQWTLQMADWIKQIDQNHLVLDGTLAGHNRSRWAPETLDSPLIDIFYNNYYWGQDDVSRIKKDAEKIKKHKKAFIICEYGFSHVQVYESILKQVIKSEIAGSMIWSLRFHSIDGGFYIHHEDNTYMSYHIPGFPHQPGFNHWEEIHVTELLRKYAYVIDGYPTIPKLPIPDPPLLFFKDSQTLSWVGSAWATHYQIYMRKEATESWFPVTDWVTDSIESGGLGIRVEKGVQFCATAKNADAISNWSSIATWCSL